MEEKVKRAKSYLSDYSKIIMSSAVSESIKVVLDYVKELEKENVNLKEVRKYEKNRDVERH